VAWRDEITQSNLDRQVLVGEEADENRAESSKNPSKKFLDTGWYRTAQAGLEKRESPARWHRKACAGRCGLDS